VDGQLLFFSHHDDQFKNIPRSVGTRQHHANAIIAQFNLRRSVRMGG